jgi:hypothetical protein
MQERQVIKNEKEYKEGKGKREMQKKLKKLKYREMR